MKGKLIRLLITALSVNMCIWGCSDKKKLRGKTTAQELIEAAYTGNINTVKSFLEAGVDVNTQNANGETALMKAAQNGQTEIVRLLLEKGADVNIVATYTGPLPPTGHDDKGFPIFVDLRAPDYEGYTALEKAAYGGYTEIVRLLVAAGANVNKKSETHGYTALMRAAEEGHADTVKLLLEAGADVNDKDNNGKAALIKAARNHHVEIVKLLLEKGSKVEVMTVADIPYEEIQELLLANVQNINVKNKQGNDALILATKRNNIKIVKLLLKNGVDVNAQDKGGNTSLLIGADNVALVKLLLEHGANVHAKNNANETALIRASRNIRGAETVKVLLAAGADVNAMDSWGYTPLMKAAYAGNVDTVQTLLEAGADVNVKNKRAETALMQIKMKEYGAAAEKESAAKIMQLLKSAGAQE